MAENGEPPANETKSLSLAGEHIKALNKISEAIPVLLESASAAISLLAGGDGDEHLESSAEEGMDYTSNDIDESDPLAARKCAFLSHVRTYYTTLRRLKDDLHVEVDALSEAGLLDSSLDSSVLGPGITNGGLGELDIGWLNSRAKDVALGKEKELVSELRGLLEYFSKKKGNPDAPPG